MQTLYIQKISSECGETEASISSAWVTWLVAMQHLTKAQLLYERSAAGSVNNHMQPDGKFLHVIFKQGCRQPWLTCHFNWIWSWKFPDHNSPGKWRTCILHAPIANDNRDKKSLRASKFFMCIQEQNTWLFIHLHVGLQERGKCF